MMKIGMNGSPAHVLTNDKIQDKKACFKELYKEAAKDAVVLTTGAAAATGIAVNRNAIADIAKKVKATPIKELPVKVFGKLKNAKPLDAIKNFKFGEFADKVKALPTPIKAGLIGAAGLFGIYSAAKSGYIEGKHETK